MYAHTDQSGLLVVPNVINGRAVELSSKQNYPIVQSSSGKTVHYAQSATVETAVAAVDAAAQAFKSWKKTTVAERRELLQKAADILLSKAEEAQKRIIDETSAPPWWPGFNLKISVEMTREIAASSLLAWGSIPPTEDPSMTSLVFKEPYGAVLIIPPWNAPLVLAWRGICSALVAGCTVVVKASELCPFTHQLILEVLEEAGFPPGVLNQVQARREDAPAVTEALISHPDLRKIEFIGSAPTGKIIGQLAAKYLKPVLMELGDQSPALVLEDADLKHAAAECARGALTHHGQICFGTERIIVNDKVKDAFVDELKAVFDNTPDSGHAVTTAGAQKAHDMLEEAVADGAKFLIGSADFVTPTSLKPSILTDLNPKSRLSKEEGFGPSATLFTVKNDDEAVAMANDTTYGLSASIFTNDFDRGLKLSRDLDFGQVQINSMTIHANAINPVTGVKGSGWGSNGGHYGIEEWLFNKHVSLRSLKTPAGAPQTNGH